MLAGYAVLSCAWDAGRPRWRRWPVHAARLIPFVVVALASAVLFKEPMPPLKWMGTTLIVLGVLLVSQTR